ncbi:cytochrome P450 [Actinosynnema sp. NPDC023794]
MNGPKWTESAEDGGYWSVVTHDLATEVLKTPGVFTSEDGMRLGGNPAAVRAAAGRMLTVSDGPRHRRIKAVHTPWFNSRAMAALSDDLQERLDGHVGALVAREEPFDVMSELARKFPAWTVFRMMGIPEGDWDHLARCTDTAYDESEAGPDGRIARSVAHMELLDYFATLADRRRADPGDDIVSALVHTEVDGSTLSDDEVVLNCDGLVVGGLQTTRHAAAGAVVAFAEHPREWFRLRADPALLPTATEEVLRWTSPPMHVLRTARTDVVLGGAPIRAGERIVVWIPSCNRDERVFPDAEVFDVDRRPNPHLSFSAGPHYCVGARLGRLELECYLRALARFVAGFDLVGSPVRLKSNFLTGWTAVPVSCRPG